MPDPDLFTLTPVHSEPGPLRYKLRSYRTASINMVLKRNQMLGSYWTSSMQFVGGYTNFGSKTKLSSICELGGCITQKN